MNIYSVTWTLPFGGPVSPHDPDSHEDLRGCDIITASNGDRAVDAVRIARPNCVVDQYAQIVLENA